MSEYTPRRKDTILYRIALTLWAGSVLSIPLCLLWDAAQLLAMLFFVASASVGVIAKLFPGDFPLPEKPWLALDKCLVASATVSAILAGIGGASLAVFGGNPATLDGQYALVSHGTLVRYVSKPVFDYLTICSRIMAPCGFLCFSALVAIGCRNEYVNHRAYSRQEPERRRPDV